MFHVFQTLIISKDCLCLSVGGGGGGWHFVHVLVPEGFVCWALIYVLQLALIIFNNTITWLLLNIVKYDIHTGTFPESSAVCLNTLFDSAAASKYVTELV